MSISEETIVAIATPPGEGAVGIVRLSGPDAFSLATRLFRGRKGLSVEEMIPYRLTLGHVVDPAGDRPIDEVLAVLMPGPRSYTGENTVELQAHGGRAVLERILRAAVSAGARPAAPGEFTRRAFLNGRIDLAQAEAVIDLIRSRSGAASRAALQQLEGRLSAIIGAIREDLADLSSRLEADLDFSDDMDDDGQCPPEALQEPARRVRELLASAGEGRALREGIQVTLAGRTNVGKSSLLNLLLEKDRSIVTPHPGTTRDTVEDRLLFDGVEALLIDTAGFGKPKDAAEEEGIRRSFTKLRTADLAISVLDSSQPLTGRDRELLHSTDGRPRLVILNKIDLPMEIDAGEVEKLAGTSPTFHTSARTGEGLEELRRAIGPILRRLVSPGESENPIITSVRHEEALRQTLQALERGEKNLRSRMPLEMVATDVRNALSALGEITGETVTEEILDRIFSRFCIGK